MAEFHQLAAAIYLAAGIGALVGVVLPEPRMRRGAAWGLALGAVVQAVAFATLHGDDTGLLITSLPIVVAMTAWMGVISLLILMWRFRLPGLGAAVGPLAFVSVFVASHGFEHSDILPAEVGTWPHAHVLLASAGIALLGIAGLAGLFFLVEHRRLKAKFAPPRRIQLPSLEALDRVNAATTAVGFVLLTLGIVTGMFWLLETEGLVWAGSTHETWMMISWAIYAGLVTARYVGHQGARQAAASALAGFAFLFFGVMGIGLIG